MRRSLPALTPATKSGILSTEPIRSTMRMTASLAPPCNGPYSAAIAALYGPLHGGANEAVIRMVERIGSVDKIPDFVAGVKAGKERLMGFGHRVYKNYDPRATVIKR